MTARLAPLGRRVHRDRQGRKDSLARKAIQVLLAPPARPARRVQLARLAHKAPLVRKAPLGLGLRLKAR